LVSYHQLCGYYICKYTKIIKELIFVNVEIRKKAKVCGESQTLTKGEARKKGDLSCELIVD
jgi:hypothetical protein